jgi:hypothetical protein
VEGSSRLSGKTEQTDFSLSLSPYGELAVIKIALPKAAKEETTYGTQNHGWRNSQTARLGTTEPTHFYHSGMRKIYSVATKPHLDYVLKNFPNVYVPKSTLRR